MEKIVINTIVALNEITYRPVAYEESLKESIHKRGIAIPVKVRKEEDHYVCVDGNKRLSVCADLAQENEKFLRIPIMILNDFSKAGSAYWGNTQNKH